MKFKQLILLGPPGAGVSEQANALSKRWHIPHVSMGQLIYNAIAKESAIGMEIRQYADGLVPDTLTIKLLRKRLEQPDVMLQGWVLEGFPRTLHQAQELNEWLSVVGQPAAQVAYLKAMTGLLINRHSAKESPEPTSAIRRRLTHAQAE
ncbi:MAG: nucleoside monophosphate kinase, partial [Symploca sp. SIO2G7]|nr:nucleoside monophosphate kinase [Symploca sp. SIO2G7]